MAIAKQKVSPGRLAASLKLATARADTCGFAARLWECDGTLWKQDRAHRAVIANRLGWLDSPFNMAGKVREIAAFKKRALRDGLKAVVLLGMGGSSLAPEVFSLIFPAKAREMAFHMIDSTDPQSIRKLRAKLDLSSTLFIIASKSGGTVETLTQFEYFWNECERAKLEDVGSHFSAITDSGSGLEARATELGFRHIFINAGDIGGRYSVLSFFGLVPASLLGIPISRLLASGQQMAGVCQGDDAGGNPALLLGALMAAASLQGVDKLTFLSSKAMVPFVPWVEQLVAESTGKEGKGVVPVEGEALGKISEYSGDRLFVRMALLEEKPDRGKRIFERAASRGDACIELILPNREALGGEFMRWELATAWASALMEINPFDEPNVKESKDNTGRILKTFSQRGDFPTAEPRVAARPFEIYSDNGTWKRIQDAMKQRVIALEKPVDALAGLLALARGGDYMALLAYMDRNSDVEAVLAELRALLRTRTGMPILRGYGPRFLHSIGQLYKGGGDNGIFIQITREDKPDLAIPGRDYTFGQLKRAQAMGDLKSLVSRGRRAIRIHLPANAMPALERLPGVVEKALVTIGL
jgi:glucose-6-phosphate isomerase